MKKLIILLLFTFLLAGAVDGYCNETITYSDSQNYTITNTCYAEDDGAIAIGSALLGLAVMLLLIFVGYIIYNEDTIISILAWLLWYIALFVPLFVVRVILSSTYINTFSYDLLSTFFVIYLIFYGFMFLMLLIYFLTIILSYLFPKHFFKEKRTGWKDYKNPKI